MHVLSTSDNGVAAVIAVMAAVIVFKMRVRRGHSAMSTTHARNTNVGGSS